jgi:hypothetical protein
VSFGWHNPFPFAFGGGETDDEEIYNALRAAVGIGGSAANEDGIDGHWRACKAGALATLAGMAERAALQAFPQIATDHLPEIEAELGPELAPRAGATDVERRLDAAAAWTRRLGADGPTLARDLALIDPRATVLEIPHELSFVTTAGKAFEPQDGSLPFGGGRTGTALPNYADEYRTTVLFNVGGLVPGPADDLVMARLRRLLAAVSPAWQDFAIVTSEGFYLDLSPLDITAMT